MLALAVVRQVYLLRAQQLSTISSKLTILKKPEISLQEKSGFFIYPEENSMCKSWLVSRIGAERWPLSSYDLEVEPFPNRGRLFCAVIKHQRFYYFYNFIQWLGCIHFHEFFCVKALFSVTPIVYVPNNQSGLPVFWRTILPGARRERSPIQVEGKAFEETNDGLDP